MSELNFSKEEIEHSLEFHELADMEDIDCLKTAKELSQDWLTLESSLSSMKRERDEAREDRDKCCTEAWKSRDKSCKKAHEEKNAALSQRDAALEQVKVAREALEGMLALADLIGQADEGLPNRWNTNGRFLIHQSQMKDCFDQYQAAKSALATLDGATLSKGGNGTGSTDHEATYV